MLSRVANSIFWISRYIERAENIARFIEVNQNLSLDFQAGLATQWSPLIHATDDEDRFTELYPDFRQANVVRFMTFDDRNPNSILSCVECARENARTIRENITTAMWEEINKFCRFVRDSAEDPNVMQQPLRFLDQVKRFSHTFLGVTDSTLSHGEAWHFCYMGRLLERADKTSRILDVKYFLLFPNPDEAETELDVVQWTALLNSTSALVMYRKRHGRIQPTKVADFLILDREFARSIRFCITQARESLWAITGSSNPEFNNRAQQVLGRLKTNLDYTNIDDIIGKGLHKFIDEFQVQLNDAGTAISECFFFPTSTSQESTSMSAGVARTPVV